MIGLVKLVAHWLNALLDWKDFEKEGQVGVSWNERNFAVLVAHPQ
jgi:hypothetical protein